MSVRKFFRHLFTRWLNPLYLPIKLYKKYIGVKVYVSDRGCTAMVGRLFICSNGVHMVRLGRHSLHLVNSDGTFKRDRTDRWWRP